jgi:hypothetical protein
LYTGNVKKNSYFGGPYATLAVGKVTGCDGGGCYVVEDQLVQDWAG